MLLRHSICNEAFHPPGKDAGFTFARACRTMRQTGYTGIEIAPFTLSDSPTELTAAQRAEFRSILTGEGLEFVGLHWLMLMPKGLHVTTPDNALREKSWAHVRGLVDLCADLAGNQTGPAANGVMVFGSPGQRNTTGGATIAEATARFRDGFAMLASHAASRGVQMLVEALPRAQSDIVNTVAEAVAIVDYCSSPGVATMFDTHNAADETEPHAAVLEKHYSHVRHIHVNEMDGKHCGRGDYKFAPIFDVLKAKHYQGWVSLEAFDFSFDPETIAGESLRHLESQGG